MVHLRNLLVTLLLICFLNLCHAGPGCKLLFKDCGSKAGSMTAAIYNGTCSSGKAMLKQGTTVSIEFDFSAKNSEPALKSKVEGKIGILPFVDFPLGNPDACKDSGLTCPVPANTPLKYKAVLQVLKTYPKVNVIVKWELQNKAGVDVFCALIPATITG